MSVNPLHGISAEVRTLGWRSMLAWLMLPANVTGVGSDRTGVAFSRIRVYVDAWLRVPEMFKPAVSIASEKLIETVIVSRSWEVSGSVRIVVVLTR